MTAVGLKTETKDGERIRRMFGSIAHRYDLLNGLLSFNLDTAWRRFAAQVSGVQGECRVLDVCAGTADLAIAYSAVVNGRGRIVGTDFCEEMVRLGKAKVKKMGLSSQITLVEADTLHLPFPDESFDVCAVAFGIRNVSDLRQGLREMCRVTRPGGRVVVLEFSQPSNKVFAWVYHLYFTKVLPLVGQVVSGNNAGAYAYLPQSVYTFPNKDELRDLMADCTLSQVEVYTKSLGIVTIHVGTK